MVNNKTIITTVVSLILLTVNAFAANVGFDLDDTLLFSTPAFKVGFDTAPFDTYDFWVAVNTSDDGRSTIKTSVKAIYDSHVDNGDTVYIITARKDIDSDAVRNVCHELFGIAKDHIYFEPNGKAERIRQLDITIFYGDSDTDIKDAYEAGATGIRIERSTDSSYKTNYTPGIYNEVVIPNTTD
jgi:acid phosphatase (class B)